MKRTSFTRTDLAAITAIILTGAMSAHAQAMREPSLPVPTPIEERNYMAARSYEGETYAANSMNRAPVALGRSSVRANAQPLTAAGPAEDALRSLPPGANGYQIKAGAFRSFENAQRLYARLYSIGSARIEPRTANGDTFYGVYLGPWKTQSEAFTAYGQAMDAGMQDGKIIDPQ